MPFDVHGALLVAVVAGVTALIRFLPFVVFGGGRPTPKFVVYLAGVLPCAIMAMLVVYCLRGVDLLGLIDADVRALRADGLPLPHMGWNRVYPEDTPHARLLFRGIEAGDWFYFVHSYAMPTGACTTARCTYGEEFTAAAAHENFMGVQFHPERSGRAGARLIANFLGIEA